MARHKKEPYTCPRCGYTSEQRSHMNKHLYQVKKPCPGSKATIELTDTIKQHILDNRVYHIPKQPKQKIINQTINNYNTMNNFINNIDVIEKLTKYMEHKNQELISFDDAIDSRFSARVQQLDHTSDHSEHVELVKEDLLKVIDAVSNICTQLPKMESFNMLYDAKMNRLKFYDNGEWTEQLILSGIQFMLKAIQDSYLEQYEFYLIRKIIADPSMMVRQRCRNLLEEYYKFIGALQVEPAVKTVESDGEILDTSSTSTETCEEFRTLYNKQRTSVSQRECNTLKKDILDIIKGNSKRNISELNKCVLDLFQMDDAFKEKIHMLLSASSSQSLAQTNNVDLI